VAAYIDSVLVVVCMPHCLEVVLPNGIYTNKDLLLYAATSPPI